MGTCNIPISSKVFPFQWASENARFVRREMDITGTNVLRNLLG